MHQPCYEPLLLQSQSLLFQDLLLASCVGSLTPPPSPLAPLSPPTPEPFLLAVALSETTNTLQKVELPNRYCNYPLQPNEAGHHHYPTHHYLRCHTCRPLQGHSSSMKNQLCATTAHSTVSYTTACTPNQLTSKENSVTTGHQATHLLLSPPHTKAHHASHNQTSPRCSSLHCVELSLPTIPTYHHHLGLLVNNLFSLVILMDTYGHLTIPLQ